MDNRNANVVSLKQVLMTLEREADLKRRQLQTLTKGNEDRRCTVEIFWNHIQNAYTTRFTNNGETLHSFLTKKSTRSLASVGIARANGLRPRVSWKDVDAGHTWKADAIVHEWYWQKYFTGNNVTPAKIINFDLFRSHLKK